MEIDIMIDTAELVRLLNEGWELEQRPRQGWFTYRKPFVRKNGKELRVKVAAVQKVRELLELDERKSHLVWKLKERQHNF
jgi:hypothetical protein